MELDAPVLTSVTASGEALDHPELYPLILPGDPAQASGGSSAWGSSRRRPGLPPASAEKGDDVCPRTGDIVDSLVDSELGHPTDFSFHGG